MKHFASKQYILSWFQFWLNEKGCGVAQIDKECGDQSSLSVDFHHLLSTNKSSATNMKDFCEFVFATKPDMKGNKGRVYLPEILFHTFLILSRILNKVRVRFCVCSCFIVSCILHFPQLPFFHLCNVHNALSKSTMILHGCNLLTNGEH